MDLVQTRRTLVIRRWKTGFKYLGVSVPKWTPFEDACFDPKLGLSLSSKRPESRVFEILSKKDEVKGRIIVHTCKPNRFYDATTPWGELRIQKSGLTTYTVSKGPQRIGSIKEGVGTSATLTFPNGQEIRLKGSLTSHSMKAGTPDGGVVSATVDTGKVPNAHEDRQVRVTWKKAKALSEEDRLKVVSLDDYTIWHISVGGILLASDDDILMILAMNICRSALYHEYAAAVS